MKKLTHVRTELNHCYGGKRIFLYYTLDVVTNGIANQYELEGTINGELEGRPYLEIHSYTHVNNNEETLTLNGVKRLIEDLIN